MSACVCVCADGTEKPRKPGQGQRKGRGQSPPPSQHPVALEAHPAHLSVFSRPPLLPLISMELIWPYSGFHGWLVSVFLPPESCWFPGSNRSFSTKSDPISVSLLVVFIDGSQLADTLASFHVRSLCLISSAPSVSRTDMCGAPPPPSLSAPLILPSLPLLSLCVPFPASLKHLSASLKTTLHSGYQWRKTHSCPCAPCLESELQNKQRAPIISVGGWRSPLFLSDKKGLGYFDSWPAFTCSQAFPSSSSADAQMGEGGKKVYFYFYFV